MKMPYQIPNYLGQTAAAMPQGQGMLRPLRSLEELQADFALADSDLDLASQLLSTEYIPNSGALGAVAMMVNAYQGKKTKKGAEAKIADLMRESSELMTRKEREELEKAAAAERRKIEALTKGFGISREQAEAAVVAGISPDKLMPKEKDPYQQYLESLPPDKREQAFAVKAGLAARPGSGTSINIDMPPGITAFDRELGKKDAVQYDTWRSNAVSASQTLERIQPIKEILSSVQTGKIPEALAIAGQYFGTDAAADLQTLRAAIQPIVLSQVKQLGSGNGITDADRKFIQDGMPGFGNDPRANERVVRIMENSARANVRLFEEADDFITKNGSLRGFRPSVTFAPQSVGGPGDGKEGAGKYTVGQTINFGGKRYRVKSIDPSNPEDPELEEI